MWPFENEHPADNGACITSGKCIDPHATACPCKLNTDAAMRNTGRKVYIASAFAFAALVFSGHMLNWW